MLHEPAFVVTKTQIASMAQRATNTLPTRLRAWAARMIVIKVHTTAPRPADAAGLRHDGVVFVFR